MVSSSGNQKAPWSTPRAELRCTRSRKERRCNRRDFVSWDLVAKTVLGGNERARLDVRMVLVIVLRKIQRHGAVGFAVDELLHFWIRVGANFVWSTLRDDGAASEHNHSGRNAKRARHVVGYNDRGHALSVGELERELVHDCGHDGIEP